MDTHASVTRTACAAMLNKAQEMGVEGVVAAALNQGDNLQMTIEVASTKGFEIVVDKNNLMAIALAKVAQSVRTGNNSGEQPAVLGENEWRGAVIDDDLLAKGKIHLVCAFSGGSEEQDVEIATTGLKAGMADLAACVAAKLLVGLIFG